MEIVSNGTFRHWAITEFVEFPEHPSIGPGVQTVAELALEILRERLTRWCNENGASYAYGQLEQCPTTKKVHYQGYVYFKNPRRATQLQGISAWSKGLSIKDVPTWYQYCSKEETRLAGPTAYGTKPRNVGVDVTWEDVFTAAEEGDFAKIPARYQIIHGRNLIQIRGRAIKPRKRTLPALWLWGPPGVGKSHYFREIRVPDDDELYIKSQNKWWDGYDGEDYVLLDDLDKSGSCLGHLLKIWTDKYKCSGEIKGGTVGLRHQQFFITSNYHPSELWPDDKMLQDAIIRRCEIRYINKNITEWPEKDHTDQYYSSLNINFE